jgi:hypothetical protein
MDYRKNAPWTAVSRERLARLAIGDGAPLQSAAAKLMLPFVLRCAGLHLYCVQVPVIFELVTSDYLLWPIVLS